MTAREVTWPSACERLIRSSRISTVFNRLRAHAGKKQPAKFKDTAAADTAQLVSDGSRFFDQEHAPTIAQRPPGRLRSQPA